MRNFITQSNSEYFFYTRPFQTKPCIKDIAKSLSSQVRWLGRSDVLYTIAQHSIEVSYIVGDLTDNKELILQGLLHDMTEAYMGDLPTGLKSLLPDYKQYEDELFAYLAGQFNIPAELSYEVKFADKVALYSEAIELFDYCPEWMTSNEVVESDHYKYLSERYCPPTEILSREKAQNEFLKLYSRLSSIIF